MQEVARLLEAAAAGRGGALLLCGGPGSGRSTLLAAASPASPADRTTLAVPGHAAERTFRFAALRRLSDQAHPSGDVVTAGDSLLLFLRTIAAHRPLLCVFDDAHLLDAPSLAVITYAARRLAGTRIAFLAAGPPSLTGCGLPTLRIPPLPPDAARALITAHAPDVTADVATAVTALAGGNPAALTDLARSLTAQQRRGYAPLPVTLPPESPLLSRLRTELEALPAATRHLLLLAAADPPAPLPDLLTAAAARAPEASRTSSPATPPAPDPGALPAPNPGALPAPDPGALPAADPGALPAPASDGAGLGGLLPAERAGLITVDGVTVRFGSALARAAAYREMSADARRTAHLALARVSAARGRELDALLHRAAAATTADPALAAALTRAAAPSAPSDAAEAFRYAAELSPAPADRNAALLDAARCAWLAGRPHEAGQLLRRAEQHAAEAGPQTPAQNARTTDQQARKLDRTDTDRATDRTDAERTADRPARTAARAGEAGARTRLRARGLAAEMRPDEPASREILMDVAAELGDADPPAALDALSLAGEAASLAGERDRYAALARRVTAGQHGDEAPAVTMAYHHVAGLAEIAAGDEGAAFTRFRQELDLAGRVAEPMPLIRAATAGILVGDAQRATASAGRAALLARSEGAHSLVPRALELAALAGMAAGDYDAATTAALDGAAVARGTGQHALAGTHLGLLAVLAAMVGDRENGQARIHTASTVDQARPLCEWALALLDLVDGRRREAAERLGTIVAGPPGRGSVLLRVAVVPHLLEAAGLETAGRESLMLTASTFDEWAGRTGQAGWLALRDRCRALRTRDGEAAEAHFHAALHRVGEGGFPRAHTELLYGRLLRRRRRHVAAREHLRRAAETFRLLGADPWAAQSVRELRAAGERPGPETTIRGTGALTAQQQRIATLVAEGATNREVAQELHLSPRTVDHHLRNVFARLGVRSRTEMAHLLTTR
ncbi:LuxR C-terminal-related transcriptional regulator [Actinoplanes awajinensis]|uniref:HTH luxR-type domain-containing protein n=1 Tax=Actinoplanes awajinensis subsp. mycoplanecinus TaxID=135947 RepID=A0A101JI99_9ACTN|nr:LuxR C-terminal-related transcriptional regulator [Actinoplanes awajinensis]KUL27368.1 hypothetical protein ADL15_35365 [Actinoplanes awajinensis subsp. mycoplanecinus]